MKHIGLKSVIANQVLRKYGRNKQTRKVRSVKTDHSVSRHTVRPREENDKDHFPRNGVRVQVQGRFCED